MSDACILHGLSEVPGGYAQRKVKGKAYYAHRLAYCADHGVAIGSIAGQVVRHSCDNARCINPKHLLLGTHQDNMDDKSKRRRVKGTKLTDEQVREIRATCVPSACGGGSHVSNQFSQAALARKFGTTPSAVRQVYLNLTHRHV